MFKKSVGFAVFYLMSFALKAQTVVNTFNTIIEPNIPLGLTNPLFNEGSPMTYNPAQVQAKGAAFSIAYNNMGGTSFDGYPSGKIGSVKINGNYYSADSNLCGMPVQIKNLKHLLRFNWDTFQQYANDPADKWWATINVIFDEGPATAEPDPLLRDYDLVIQHVSYEQDNFEDLPDDGNGRYWYFARDAITNQIKPFTLHLNGQTYEWAVRYKFFNYPAASEDAYQNDKVHVKFIPINNNDTLPFFDHSLKSFVDATKDYLNFLNLTTTERQLANEKVANPELWIKGIAAGYEVYEGQSILQNLYFFSKLDTVAPSAPQNLSSSLSGNTISLDWDDTSAGDFEHYTVFRSVNLGAFEKIADSLYNSHWQDLNISTNNNYRYYVSSTDRSFNKSVASNIVNSGCQKPDLVITQAEVQKYGSGQIMLQITVSNEGFTSVNNLQSISLAIYSSTDNSISGDDELLPLQYPLSGSLAAGHSTAFTLVLPIDWASDKHYRLFSIDNSQVLNECNEGNNLLSLLVKKCNTEGPLVLSGNLASGLYATNQPITIEPNTVFSDNIVILGKSIIGFPTQVFANQNINLMTGSCISL